MATVSLTQALATLTTGDFATRWEIAKQLPTFGDAAIAPLIALLQDVDADIQARWFAARILGHFRHPAVITALVDTLASQTTGDMQSELDEDDEADWVDLAGAVATALATMGSDAIAPLTHLLTDPQTRRAAVQTLVQIPHRAIVPPLLTVVTDEQPPVRAIALEALSHFQDQRIPPLLVHALADPVAVVRQTAVMGLGFCTWSDLDVVELLHSYLWDLHLDVCRQTANSLGRVGTVAAADRLWQRLQQPTPLALSLDLIHALGAIDHPSAIAYLATYLNQSPPARLPIQQEIIATLGRVQSPDLQPQVVDVLLQVWSDSSRLHDQPPIRQAIALALGHLGDRRALLPLLQRLDETNAAVRLHIIRALKQLDVQLARQLLESWIAAGTMTEAWHQGAAIALQEWAQDVESELLL